MINKEQILDSEEIDDILVKLATSHDQTGLATLYNPIGRIHHPIMRERTSDGTWDFDRFWEDALSIFAEQFNKE